MKKVLSIAGSDCSGGAGIQADLKTFSAHGVFGMSAVVSVVAENTCRVLSIEDMSIDIICKQIDAVYEDITPDAVKIGMLSSEEIMEAVAQKLLFYKVQKTVLDPVMYAKNGTALMQEKAVQALIRHMLPIAYVATPNIPEAEVITGIKISNLDDMQTAALQIYRTGCKNVVIKGGHHMGDATDILYDGDRFHRFTTERINTKNTHGTGCTFSSAIASNLALGYNVYDSVKLAKDYITGAIRNSLSIGKCYGPTNHFHEIYDKCGLTGGIYE